ncbi:MAG: orotidine-5'-phosphate decarboxylase [Chloracidobacterium sp.]|nr:orotidine-5'-phosphate decarboxylase [Chloracidobacterium sp.]MDW8218546.1 orotidine-5'-phosphate decarboxylase [Acidobacteriota bacterium]
MDAQPSPSARIFLALDTPDRSAAERLMQLLSPYVGGFKIGKTLFTAAGPPVVAAALATGARVFLDLKFHDIPHTVAGAVAAAAALGVHLCTVHTLGGSAMLRAAQKSLATWPTAMQPVLLGVTLLTSADQTTLNEIGLQGTPEEAVRRLTKLAVTCGLGGVVCSPQEIAAVRRLAPADFLVVTPGIRFGDAVPDDQRRTLTPREALAAGADYLVVGRPITAAPDPVAAVQRLVSELSTS